MLKNNNSHLVSFLRSPVQRCGCSVTRCLEIVPAGRDAYDELGRHHYRGGVPGPFAAIYALCETHPVRSKFVKTVGVIVYTMPASGLELRDVATNGRFSGLGGRAMQLQMVNENIRCISRVIIEPRYRGLGLASRLVRETMPRMGVPIIEALAVMGKINPFFERAGMTAYVGGDCERTVRLTEAFGMVGVDDKMILDPCAVQARIDALDKGENDFINRQMRGFLQAYGKRRYMTAGIERTRFVLSRLTDRAVYYIWMKNGQF